MRKEKETHLKDQWGREGRSAAQPSNLKAFFMIHSVYLKAWMKFRPTSCDPTAPLQ